VELEASISGFVQLLLENLAALLKTRAVFVFIALLENTSYASKVAPSLSDRLEDQEDEGLRAPQRLQRLRCEDCIETHCK
jgi:hypothetical protein